MSKFHALVSIDTTGDEELGIEEFTQDAHEGNVVYLYVSGDVDIPSINFEDIPMCEHEAMDDYDDCDCRYGEELVKRVIRYYEDLGFEVQVINMASFISTL